MIKFLKRYLLIGILFFSNIFGDVKIYNETLYPIFVATYYAKDNKANIVGNIKNILPNDFFKFKRPHRKLMNDREIIFSYNENDIKKTLSGAKYLNSNKTNIGDTKGFVWHIVPNGSALKAYSWSDWSIRKKTKVFLNKYFKSIINYYFKKKAKGGRVATVRESNDLSKQEKLFLSKRFPVANKNLKKFTKKNFTLSATPNIAVCASGGGYRAMLTSLGLFKGLEKMGLLDSIIYAAGLSGSSWFISPWLFNEESVSDYKKRLKPKVEIGLGMNKNKKGKPRVDFPLRAFMRYATLKKKIDGQSMSSVDIYGAMLADRLFSELNRFDRQRVTLSSLGPKISNGTKPFPVLTAVQPGLPFTWFEFTPYEVGLSLGGNFVPTWALGRQFMAGKSLDFDREASLGYFMGIWGSAYTLKYEKLFTKIEDKLPGEFKGWIDRSLRVLGDTNERLSPAIIENFNYGLKDAPFENMRNITLVDGGLDFNLPFPAVLRPERNIDIIIVCDASTSAHNHAPAVKKAEEWAKKNGIKFPPINFNIIGQGTISIFKNEDDKSIPTIIYLSLVKNDKFDSTFDPVKEIQGGFCNTFNFVYNGKQFEQLTGLMEYNLIEAKEIIKKEIIDKIKYLENNPHKELLKLAEDVGKNR